MATKIDPEVERLQIRRQEIELRAARRRGLSPEAHRLWRLSNERRKAALEGREVEPGPREAYPPTQGSLRVVADHRTARR